MESRINSFSNSVGKRNAYSFLSNFYSSPIVWEGIEYPTVEHAYQASKTHDQTLRRRISEKKYPGAAKAMGGALPIRPDWDRVRIPIMRQLLSLKFDPERHPGLCKMLVGTGTRELIHGNYWGDTFWGVCLEKGQNQLGLLLMEIRDKLSPNRGGIEE